MGKKSIASLGGGLTIFPLRSEFVSRPASCRKARHGMSMETPLKLGGKKLLLRHIDYRCIIISNRIFQEVGQMSSSSFVKRIGFVRIVVSLRPDHPKIMQ
jgi:hypothetical protein